MELWYRFLLISILIEPAYSWFFSYAPFEIAPDATEAVCTSSE